MENLGLKLSSRLCRLMKVLEDEGVRYNVTEDGNTVILPLKDELTVVIGDNQAPSKYDPFCYTAVCLAESKESVEKEYEGYASSKPISLRLASWACRERSKVTGSKAFNVSNYDHTLYEIKSALAQYLNPTSEVLN